MEWDDIGEQHWRTTIFNRPNLIGHCWSLHIADFTEYLFGNALFRIILTKFRDNPSCAAWASKTSNWKWYFSQNLIRATIRAL